MASEESMGAAAAAQSDAWMAHKLHAIEQLTGLYGFPPEVAEQAVDFLVDVTSTPSPIDVAECCNYILDSGLAVDQGGPITPISHCPHVLRHCSITPSQLPFQPSLAPCSFDPADLVPTGNAKSEASNDDVCRATENWLCLECAVVRCSRYCQGHAHQHWQETQTGTNDPDGHCVAVSLSDLSVWCHRCQAYLSTSPGAAGRDLLVPLLEQLERSKSIEPAILILQPEAEPRSSKKLKQESDDSNRPIDSISEEEKDEEESELEDAVETGDNDDNGAREELVRQLMTIADEQGIPLEWLLRQVAGADADDSDDDGAQVEYPFEFPTSIHNVAEFILSPQCQRILILAGAGMSVASGIPDFRSADGLYATLNPDALTADGTEREAIRLDPTIALDQHMFLQNPLPCLELQREFILGTREQRWKATLAHRFIELLHQKTGKLVRHYTQNIDGLEDQCTQLPSDKVIAVHGSMDHAECARCKSPGDFQKFCDQVQSQIKDLSGQDNNAPAVSTPIECPVCGCATMKPAIVLFRSSLPKSFAQNVPRDIVDVDLLIVIGTSLRVAPANHLVRQVPRTALRVLVNREEAGAHLGMNFDDKQRDFFAQGECDAVLLELMDSLGWIEDLEYLLPNKLLPESSAQLLQKHLRRRAAGTT